MGVAAVGGPSQIVAVVVVTLVTSVYGLVLHDTINFPLMLIVSIGKLEESHVSRELNTTNCEGLMLKLVPRARRNAMEWVTRAIGDLAETWDI